MKKAKIYLAIRLPHIPNDVTDHQVIQIITDIPNGQINSFYIETVDKKNTPIILGSDHPPGDPLNSTYMNPGDSIEWNLSDGLFHQCALWKGRKIRQCGYPFDDGKNIYTNQNT